MRVDAHLHVGLGLDETALIRYMDRERMDVGWLLSWEEIEPGPWPYEALPVEAIAEVARAHPDRFVPMYAPDPRRPDAGDRLRARAAQGFGGCAELKTPLPWHAPEVRALLETVDALGFPVVFHMEVSTTRIEPRPGDGALDRLGARILSMRRLGVGTHRWLNGLVDHIAPLQKWRDRRSYRFPGYLLDFASLADTLATFSGVRFVAHGPLWWQHLAGGAAEGGTEYPRGPVRRDGLVALFLERFPNLYADLSGFSGLNALQRDPGHARRFCERFSHKLLYGTDNHEPGRLAALLRTLDLSRPTQTRILGANALELLAAI
jgi:predicted TIM-barrel fold metal-dependent hydrolase